MMDSVLHRQRARFDEQNRFLSTVLGVASLLDRWIEVLDRHGQPTRIDDAAAVVPDDSPVLLAVLGAVACAARLREALDTIAQEAAPGEEPGPAPQGAPPPTLRSLLS